MANDSKSRDTRQRLEKCWPEDLNWELLPAAKRGIIISERSDYYTTKLPGTALNECTKVQNPRGNIA